MLLYRTAAPPTLTLKKKIKFSSYIRKFRMEQLQSHIWLTASSYMGSSYICAFPDILGSPSSYMTLQLLHSEFPYIWGKFDLLFYQCIFEAFIREDFPFQRHLAGFWYSNNSRGAIGTRGEKAAWASFTMNTLWFGLVVRNTLYFFLSVFKVPAYLV